MGELFCKEEKYQDFMAACESVRRENGSYMSVFDMVSVAIQRPAKSFYLNPRVYSKIIWNDGQYLPKEAAKRELHLEILRRAREVRAVTPSLKIHEIAKIIEEQSAPRFYMSLRGATNLYYSLLRKKS